MRRGPSIRRVVCGSAPCVDRNCIYTTYFFNDYTAFSDLVRTARRGRSAIAACSAPKAGEPPSRDPATRRAGAHRGGAPSASGSLQAAAARRMNGRAQERPNGRRRAGGRSRHLAAAEPGRGGRGFRRRDENGDQAGRMIRGMRPERRNGPLIQAAPIRPPRGAGEPQMRHPPAHAFRALHPRPPRQAARTPGGTATRFPVDLGRRRQLEWRRRPDLNRHGLRHCPLQERGRRAAASAKRRASGSPASPPSRRTTRVPNI